MSAEVSDRQWSDVIGLLRMHAATIDVAYLKQWAHALGLDDATKRALSESGFD
jgi:hypothetical protein